MTSRDAVHAAVAAALESKPSPESLDDLSPAVRRDVEREAARRGVSPADVWREVLATDRKARDDAEEAARIVAALRGRGGVRP
ncbi:hypothetical protein [Curtobacterium sp. MCBD17_019]|uniref:hypothetical protein n=1 Tax=Curtobacterium sp. MCBD17_019 TaxID=2175669 RepID=UPI000DA71FCF|nr:hypothetical protein [Curtobacterium sp. MCBD17_019]PZE73441.1 hypothetical protein DEI82_14390 [Curtobacterium sp. MCBD17_019]